MTVFGRAFPDGVSRADLATILRAGEQALNSPTPRHLRPRLRLWQSLLVTCDATGRSASTTNTPSTRPAPCTTPSSSGTSSYAPATGLPPFICWTRTDTAPAYPESSSTRRTYPEMVLPSGAPQFLALDALDRHVPPVRPGEGWPHGHGHPLLPPRSGLGQGGEGQASHACSMMYRADAGMSRGVSPGDQVVHAGGPGCGTTLRSTGQSGVPPR